ncbi:hypothetical protein JW906_14285 [bacterium]|nr:hypothetical protein [bacterium]
MKIDGILKKYYERILANMDAIPMPDFPGRGPRQGSGKKGAPAWEQALGYAVTAAYLLQWLMPDKWFLAGRLVSMFRIGF